MWQKVLCFQKVIHKNINDPQQNCFNKRLLQCSSSLESELIIEDHSLSKRLAFYYIKARSFLLSMCAVVGVCIPQRMIVLKPQNVDVWCIMLQYGSGYFNIQCNQII